MFIVLVFITVQSDHLDPFIIATLEMAHASLKEAGCRRFEVIHEENDPTRFILYEAFNSRADGEAHLETTHFKQWKATTAPLLAEPSRAVTYTQLF